MARRLLIGIGAAFVAVVAGTSAYFFLAKPGANSSVASQSLKNCPGGYAGAAVGGPFDLIDQKGEQFTHADLEGTPSLMYFGFATCPDVCPTDLAYISSATDILAEKGVDVRPIFVTVDPERDTPERLAEHVEFFHPSMIGLTGTLETIKAAAKAYRVFYQKAQDPEFPDGYTMDHSANTYLLGADGSFMSFYRHGTSPEDMAEAAACHLGG